MLQNADRWAAVKASSFKDRNDAASALFGFLPVAGAKPKLDKLAVLLGVYQKS